MIEARHQQRKLAEGPFAEEEERWTEAWMEKAHHVLEDEELVDLVYDALGRRCPIKSSVAWWFRLTRRTHSAPATRPAGTWMRMWIR